MNTLAMISHVQQLLSLMPPGPPRDRLERIEEYLIRRHSALARRRRRHDHSVLVRRERNG